MHGGNVNLLDSPHLSTLAGSNLGVSSTAGASNSRAKGGISRGESDNSVQVLLRSDSSGAVVVALSSRTVSK